MTCAECGNSKGMDFKCITCCVNWLKTMPDDDYRKLNAPAIKHAVSEDHLNAVREEYKLSRMK